MVIHRNEMKVEEKEKMRDGNGTVQFTYFAESGTQKNARMLAELTLPPGASIGYHQHDAETEYFFILSGNGTV
ncbi:MAG: cupin domain-containing protein, partial [Treponema sp.]|nr:cupin domain-containing protein [Treponema sp.]